MIRSIPLIALVALVALAAAAVPATAQGLDADLSAGPTLKAAATVTGDIVRIGDLVENAGAVAEVAIFRAPDLGQTGSVPVASVLDRVREGDDDPHCELCGELLKTATISFGQSLIVEDVDHAMEEAGHCDACLAVGSTLAVWPAAGVPVRAVKHGGRLVIVNDGATELDAMADAILAGKAGVVLPALVDALLTQPPLWA